MLIKNINLKTNAGLFMLDEPRRYETFSAVSIYWDTIPKKIRRRLIETFPNLYYEFDDDCFFAAFIIPHKDNRPDLKNIYLYCNRYNIDDDDAEEIDRYISHQDTYLKNNFEEVELSMHEQVYLLSRLIPSDTCIDDIGKENGHEYQNGRCGAV